MRGVKTANRSNSDKKCHKPRMLRHEIESLCDQLKIAYSGFATLEIEQFLRKCRQFFRLVESFTSGMYAKLHIERRVFVESERKQLALE